MQSLWMVAAALAFALMGALVKRTSLDYSAFEIVFYRGLVSAAAMGWFIRQRGHDFGTGRLWMHVRRSVIGTASMLCWFYAIGHLPLATGMTLNYTAPVFIALLLTVMAGWQMRRANIDPATQPDAGHRHGLYLTIASGFAGVLIMLRPSVADGDATATLLGLLSGLLSAFAYLQIRAMGRIGEPEWRVVFYFSVINCLCGLVLAALDGFHALTASGAASLLGVGVLAMSGQLMMTRAFSRGNALLTASLQYSGIVFASLVGWLAFGELTDWTGLLGMLLVIGSGVFATWLSTPSRDKAAGSGAAPATGRPPDRIRAEQAAGSDTEWKDSPP